MIEGRTALSGLQVKTVLLLIILMPAVTVSAPAQAARSGRGGTYRPGIGAVWYADDLLRISGERLEGLTVTPEHHQRRYRIRVPEGRRLREEVTIEGSSELIVAVELVDESPEDDRPRVLDRILPERGKPGDLVLEVTLRDAAIVITTLGRDGRSATVEFRTAGRRAEIQERSRAPVGGEGYATVALQYAEAEALAVMLRRLVDRGDRVVQVVPGRNELILDRGMERYLDIRELVDRLDRAGAQILIEAQVVEINTDRASQLGLEMSDSISAGFSEQSDYGRSVPIPLQSFLRSPVEIRATLHLLAGEGEAQILANPRVATMDGVPAVMRTEERFPIIVTQSSGGQSYQTKQDIVGGIELSIVPRYNGEGEITARISTDVTTITGTTREGYPTTSSRRVETTVRVQSGTAIVIGGLVEKREIRHRDRIPLLGDIPVLGVLFTNYRTSVQETDLFVIVTPYVIEGVQ